MSRFAVRQCLGQQLARVELQVIHGTLYRRIPGRRLAGSMGRGGTAGDNAAMERFYALLQKYVIDRQHRTTRQQLRTAIVT